MRKGEFLDAVAGVAPWRDLARHPPADFLPIVVGVAFHERGSSSTVFDLAAATALREAFELASPRWREPVMAVKVVTPSMHVGARIGDRCPGALRQMFGYIGARRTPKANRRLCGSD